MFPGNKVIEFGIEEKKQLYDKRLLVKELTGRGDELINDILVHHCLIISAKTPSCDPGQH